MGIIERISPFKEQDSLDTGFLKTESGDYFDIDYCTKEIDGRSEEFSPFDEQDRLSEGLVKIKSTGDYIPINEIDEVQYEEIDGCFIATAVYGNIQKQQVQILRDFRDNVLMKNKIGKGLVSLYYGGAGKKTAFFIKEQIPSSIPIIRKGLDFLVDKYSKRK